jgi:DNA (cytosine-5)-methyltransferase 1
MSNYTGISLFSSAGMADLAYKSCGIDVVVACELLPDRASIFEKNFPDCNMIQGNIEQEYSKIIHNTQELLGTRELDFLFATPPCQGMSSNGMGKLLQEIKRGNRPVLDPRNQLITYVPLVAEKLLPTTIVIENVPQMANTFIEHPVNKKLVKITDYLTSELGRLGYIGQFKSVNFAGYGIPQDRKRFIAVFSKNPVLNQYLRLQKAILEEFVAPENFRTVREAISHMPLLDAGQKSTCFDPDLFFHRVPYLEPKKYTWVKNTPPEKGAFDNQCIECGFSENPVHRSQKINGINQASKETPIFCLSCNALLPRPYVKMGESYRIMKGFTSAYKRMKWDKPATTLTRNLQYACSDSKLHPEQNRVLSLHEAFILHSLDNYSFLWEYKNGKSVTDSKIADCLGESIPPYGMQLIVQNIIDLINSTKNIKQQESQLQLSF